MLYFLWYIDFSLVPWLISINNYYLHISTGNQANMDYEGRRPSENLNICGVGMKKNGK